MHNKPLLLFIAMSIIHHHTSRSPQIVQFHEGYMKSWQQSNDATNSCLIRLNQLWNHPTTKNIAMHFAFAHDHHHHRYYYHYYQHMIRERNVFNSWFCAQKHPVKGKPTNLQVRLLIERLNSYVLLLYIRSR